jgi:hypothetical protein
MAEMAPRCLCSHLVTLSWSGGERVVNLEEIWPGGAVLESDDAFPAGIHADIRCGEELFAGRITSVEEHEFGWRLEMEFSPLTPWSPERFEPDHMVDISG